MIKLYNTKTRKKELFKPINPPRVSLYTCGPTVYNYAHIGNLRSYVFADLLHRTLLAADYKVKQVMNITDVGHLTDDADQGEDKMEKSAKREGKTARDIAEFYTHEFHKDVKALNILPPTQWCKATDHIQEQIDLVKKLQVRGHTYKTSDGVYFDTSTFSDYGALVGKKALAGLQEGARIEKGEKKNPTDFALWKFSPSTGSGSKRQMEWDSPWGTGFPGWHIECSAMSMKYLGDTFDIHTGGIDHIPVHHTNEIAQAEAATGKPFVRVWMHGEFLVVDSGRMGKSEGNFIPLHVLTERGYDPLAYRYFLLQTHYRKQLLFSWDALDAAQNGYQNLIARVAALNKASGDVAIIDKSRRAFFDDLNAPQALAALWSALKSKNPPSQDAVYRLDDLFGLNLKKKVSEFKKILKNLPPDVKKLVKEREAARKKKDFRKADALRKKIEKAGWHTDDRTEGSILYPKK